jgi:arylsulfatase A-like enzyme
MGILVATGPRVPEKDNTPRYICDICPTALDALEIAIPDGLDGKSILL